MKKTTKRITYSLLILSFFISSFSFSYAQDAPEVKIGGALRLNYNNSSWKDQQQQRGGDFGFDVFRINTNVAYKGLKLNAEYRQYSTGFGGGMLKQGWVAYDFSEKNEIQVGLTQVPFGITKYNSHSWFFSLNYYIGLEDDHDMGIKYSHRGDKWEYDFAFFKNAEELQFGDNTDVSDSRYAYDVSSIDLNGDGNPNLRNKEINQFNFKLLYKFGGDKVKSKLGFSAEYGGLYNLDTKKNGSHNAFAVHYQLQAGNFDLKAQYSLYEYNAENLPGDPEDVIAMTAYGAPYLVASKASVYTFGVAYSIPVKWNPISSLQIYNDFGMMQKGNSSFKDSMMNVTGVLVTAGSIYTYIDFAAGKSQPWLGSEWTNALALGNQKTDKWEARFNINIGFYF